MRTLSATAVALSLLSLLLTLPLLPDAGAANPPLAFYIPPQHRVSVPGACMWNCVESTGRTLGYHSLRGLAEHKKATTNGGADQNRVRQVLNDQKIPYMYSAPDSYNYPALKAATAQGHGVIVGVQTRRHNPTPTSGHAIVVIHANNSKVTYWNPSAPQQIGTVNAVEFRKDWFGNGLYILPHGRQKK